MNQDHLSNNLGSVRREVRDIVENISAVRGERHAHLTMGFVHASMLSQLSRVMALAPGHDAELVRRCGEAFVNALAGTIREFTDAGGFSDQELVDAIQEAQSVEGSIDSMTSAALKMARAGKTYGAAE